jgi:membrane-associated phospholipid phosphatase
VTPHELPAWLAELEQIDRALYEAVGATPTPVLDGAMRRLSEAADHSKLSIASAGLLAVTGGSKGRRAARSGLVPLAATSAFVNLVVKRVARRHRPDREVLAAAPERHVSMPSSRSFPSGHAAAAVAFASGVGNVSAAAALPLHALAAVVAYSRVHTGVHYPGDVIAGALIGLIIADLTAS